MIKITTAKMKTQLFKWSAHINYNNVELHIVTTYGNKKCVAH